MLIIYVHEQEQFLRNRMVAYLQVMYQIDVIIKLATKSANLLNDVYLYWQKINEILTGSHFVGKTQYAIFLKQNAGKNLARRIHMYDIKAAIIK